MKPLVTPKYKYYHIRQPKSFEKESQEYKIWAGSLRSALEEGLKQSIRKGWLIDRIQIVRFGEVITVGDSTWKYISTRVYTTQGNEFNKHWWVKLF